MVFQPVFGTKFRQKIPKPTLRSGRKIRYYLTKGRWGLKLGGGVGEVPMNLGKIVTVRISSPVGRPISYL